MRIDDALLQTIPPLYAQERKGENAIVHLHIHSHVSGWHWYATEYSPEEQIFFGYVTGFENEYGYFSRKELEDLPPGYVSLDLDFKPTRLKDLLAKISAS